VPVKIFVPGETTGPDDEPTWIRVDSLDNLEANVGDAVAQISPGASFTIVGDPEPIYDE
jgi:hypothetical protein